MELSENEGLEMKLEELTPSGNTDSRLHHLLGVVYSGHRVGTWGFSGETRQLYFSSALHESQMQTFFRLSGCEEYAFTSARELEVPFLMSDRIGMIWLGEYATLHEGTRLLVLMGPMFYASTSKEYVENLLRRLVFDGDIPANEVNSYRNILADVPIVPAPTVLTYARMLHFSIHQKPLASVDVHHQTETLQQASDPVQPGNRSWMDYELLHSQEEMIQQCVREGDLNYREILGGLNYAVLDLPLSGNPLQSERNKLASAAALFRRAAIEELVNHGVCADLKEASLLAFQAGVDIDMCSMAYYRYLPELVREGRIDEAELDAAVLRVLRLKNKLGLFENPFKDASEPRFKHVTLCAEHRAAARKAVSESLVLLKNEGEAPLLPLAKGKRIALIGPYVESKELHSAWAPNGLAEDAVSIREAAGELEDYSFTYSAGCRMTTREDLLAQSREHSIPELRKSAFTNEVPEAPDILQVKAMQKAMEADTVVLFLGEHRSLSGEGASRADISLPVTQLELLRAVAKVNRNIVTVVFSGRPLDLREVCRLSQTVVMAWLPGTEGGHGILDVLTGKENFSGKLPMSVPVSVGQIPVSYNQLRTGRPKDPVKDDPLYRSAYLDTPNRPLFPFGYGLSYSNFSLSPVKLSVAEVEGRFDPEDRDTVLLTACAEVCNTSDRAGTLTVQLYLRDDAASLARPVRELKGFRRVELSPGEKQTVSFDITPFLLSFTGEKGKRILEPGGFTLWIGEDSDTENAAHFVLK